LRASLSSGARPSGSRSALEELSDAGVMSSLAEVSDAGRQGEPLAAPIRSTRAACHG
jgi:hypothetical protein